MDPLRHKSTLFGDGYYRYAAEHFPKADEIKRTQVTQACLHCRQKHIACDQKRPCERCLLAKIECVDVPRKKRSKKQGTTITNEGDPANPVPMVQNTVAAHSLQTQTRVANNEQNPRWEDAMFNELFATSVSYQDFVMKQPQLVDARNFTTVSEFTSPVAPMNEKSESSASDDSPDAHPHLPKEVLEYLTKQISDLRTSNQVLTYRLKEVVAELEAIKKQQQLIHHPSHGTDLAISLWVVDPQSNEKYLVECNEHFVSLLGMPLHVLKNKFTTRDLIHKIFPAESKDGRSQRRTLINTSSGVTEVFMTVTPVYDQHKRVSYHIVHILAAPSPSSSTSPPANSVETTPTPLPQLPQKLEFEQDNFDQQVQDPSSLFNLYDSSEQ